MNVYYYELISSSSRQEEEERLVHRMIILEGQAEGFEDPVDHLLWTALNEGYLGRTPRVLPLAKVIELPGTPFQADSFIMCNYLTPTIELRTDGTSLLADVVARGTVELARQYTKEDGRLVLIEKIHPPAIRLATGEKGVRTKDAYSKLLGKCGYLMCSCFTYSFSPDKGLDLVEVGEMFAKEGPERYVIVTAVKAAEKK